MNYLVKSLKRDEKLEKRIKIICSFNKAKCKIKEGKIIEIENTNISMIKPHRIIIKSNSYKLLVLYYDSDNIFLYDRSMPIDERKISIILNELNKKVQNV